mmetsp:Transcript_6972/g.10190  ORF Transcript_6972/g.10190 Transcript_6972/m.10190 type:complete len:371 (+) Transcript_6972:301-1413(+)
MSQALQTAGLFVTREGNVTPAFFLIMIAFPLLWSRRWILGFACIFLGLVVALRRAMDEMAAQDKAEIRFRILKAHDVVQEMKSEKDAAILNSALESLAEKINNTQKHKEYADDEVELHCLEAAYTALKRHEISPDDLLLAGSLSLLALVAKNKAVRTQCQKFGLKLPLTALKQSLEVSSQMPEEELSEPAERISADVQRKGCLWLGALADNNKRLATLVVDEGGLEAILSAIDWYRHHQDVNNWGLWAIFILCYEHSINQMELVRLGGLQILCQSLENNCDSLEVCRHGVAVLFDLLRNTNNDSDSSNNSRDDMAKLMKMRKVAIGSGLHNAVHKAMKNCQDSIEIVGMGAELLISTGFQGDIPVYQGVK